MKRKVIQHGLRIGATIFCHQKANFGARKEGLPCDLAYLTIIFSILILYYYIAYTTTGYDDEFFNINLIEQFGVGAVVFTQSSVDVHPPLSYLINAILYSIFPDWRFVRIVSATLFLIALFYFCFNLAKLYGREIGALTFILVSADPGVAMFTTSVRWHPYFLAALLWMLVVPAGRIEHRLLKYFFGVTLLFYINYLALIVAVPLAIMYFGGLWREMISINKLSYALVPIASALILIPQVRIFIESHLVNLGDQSSGILKSIESIYISVISNQGLFPYSIWSLFGALGFLTLLGMFIATRHARDNLRNIYLLPLLTFSTLLFLSGLGAKFRNLVVLAPFLGAFTAICIVNHPHRKRLLFPLVIMLGSYFAGLYNVIVREGTTKNSWDLPVAAAISSIQVQSSNCDNDVLILTFDPALSYHLRSRGWAVRNPYWNVGVSETKSHYSCVFVLWTYVGSMDRVFFERLNDEVSKLVSESTEEVLLESDDFYRYKVARDPLYPEFRVRVVKYKSVRNVTSLSAWSRPTKTYTISINKAPLTTTNESP